MRHIHTPSPSWLYTPNPKANGRYTPKPRVDEWQNNGRTTAEQRQNNATPKHATGALSGFLFVVFFLVFFSIGDSATRTAEVPTSTPRTAVGVGVGRRRCVGALWKRADRRRLTSSAWS